MSDDKRLKQAVLDELQWEPSVNAAHIGVTAKDGVVTLMGHVENFFEKSAAEKAARRVKDVKKSKCGCPLTSNGVTRKLHPRWSIG
jgi:osmotically-inducible protein OsmY